MKNLSILLLISLASCADQPTSPNDCSSCTPEIELKTIKEHDYILSYLSYNCGGGCAIIHSESCQNHRGKKK